MRFTLRQLQLFVAACELGSLTAAAQQEHIAQSAVSAAIQSLERSLGFPLLIRHHAHGVFPTPEGRQLLPRARELLDAARDLDRLSDTVATDVAGPLEIGCLVTVAPILLPRLCRSFLDRYPAVELRITEGGQDELLDGLRSGAISLALTYDLAIDAGAFTHEPLVSLPPKAVLPADSPFASQQEIRLQDLAPLPFVLLDLPLSREYFLTLFRAAGLEPRIAHRSPHPEMVRSLVANDFGYSLINMESPEVSARDGRSVITRPLAGEHRPMVLGLARRPGSIRSRTVAAFRDHARDEVGRSVNRKVG